MDTLSFKKKKRIHKSLEVLNLYSACFETPNLNGLKLVLFRSCLPNERFTISKYGKASYIYGTVSPCGH